MQQNVRGRSNNKCISGINTHAARAWGPEVSNNVTVVACCLRVITVRLALLAAAAVRPRCLLSSLLASPSSCSRRLPSALARSAPAAHSDCRPCAAVCLQAARLRPAAPPLAQSCSCCCRLSRRCRLRELAAGAVTAAGLRSVQLQHQACRSASWQVGAPVHSWFCSGPRPDTLRAHHLVSRRLNPHTTTPDAATQHKAPQLGTWRMQASKGCDASCLRHRHRDGCCITA